jgi:uncharacterized protein (TIGR02145 family)
MSYPYLPVNPCCTDVVLNTPCGCSSIYTNGGCENPCGTHLTASSTIVYDGPALPCIVAEPCDTLNVILQKIDEIICNLLTQINILNIQIDNMTTQIINIEGDIINIYNQLGECCNATTTTTSTAAPVICESFSLTNTGVDPVAIIITDCYSDEQEAIILNPGDTNICVVTDSPLTVPGTVIVIPNGPCGTTTTTSTSSSSTTTTSTTAYPCECLTFYNGSISSQEITYIDCNGVDQYHIILPDATNSYCGCCGEAPGSIDVTITIGANCINGECPTPTTTTTSTTIVETCSCVDIIISQDDLDDATGNTLPFFDGKVNLYPDKNLTCEDGSLEAYYSVAGTYTHCLKGSVIPTIILQYVKDNNVITSVQSQIVNLDSPCLVDGECIPTTTTTTTTECTRPSGLITVDYFNTYTYDDVTVDYTGSLLDACTACNFIYNNGPSIQEETSLFGQSGSFAVGQLVYAGTLTSCDLLADGFYITDHQTCEITQIVDGYIVDISNCEITTTTTTTTTFAGPCTCMDITIAQTDLDDATGNTTPGISNNAVYLTTSKGSSCDGSDIDRTYTSVEESESWCIKTASISTIQMFYYKNNVPVYLPAIDSTYTILYSACSVKEDCSPTTTTTTTSTTLPSVTICSQIWTLENLDVETYRNGDVIPQVTDPIAWENLTTGAWCYYNNNSANGPIYGKLYNWYAVTDPRGLAPIGYHVPTDAEFETLIVTCLGGETVAGGKMKSTGTTLWNSPNTDATNSSGFTGLPAGSRNYDGQFLSINDSAAWWTSTPNVPPGNPLTARSKYVVSNFGFAYSLNTTKTTGLSVRLIKD